MSRRSIRLRTGRPRGPRPQVCEDAQWRDTFSCSTGAGRAHHRGPGRPRGLRVPPQSALSSQCEVALGVTPSSREASRGFQGGRPGSHTSPWQSRAFGLDGRLHAAVLWRELGVPPLQVWPPTSTSAWLTVGGGFDLRPRAPSNAWASTSAVTRPPRISARCAGSCFTH